MGQSCRRGRAVLDAARIQRRRVLDPGCEGCVTADDLVAGIIAYRPLDRTVSCTCYPPTSISACVYFYLATAWLLHGYCIP